MEKYESVDENYQIVSENRKRTSRSQDPGPKMSSQRGSRLSGSKSKVRKSKSLARSSTHSKKEKNSGSKSSVSFYTNTEQKGVCLKLATCMGCKGIDSPSYSAISEVAEPNEEAVIEDKTEVEHERVSSQRVASQNFISEREDKSKMEEVSTLKRSEPFIEIQMQTVSNSVRQRDSPEVEDEVLLFSRHLESEPIEEAQPLADMIPWTKYKPPQHLLPFFLCHTFAEPEQAVLDLDELWFKSNENIEAMTIKNFKTIETELYQMLDQDSVLNLLIEQKRLEDNFKKKDFELQTALKVLHDIKQQCKALNQLNTDRKPISTVMSLLLDRKSASVMSSKRTIDNAKSSVSALLKKHTSKQEKAVKESIVSLKNRSIESVEKIKGRQWIIAKNNRITKEERRNIALGVIEELKNAKERIEINTSTPISDFYIKPPTLQWEISHADQINTLHNEYMKFWDETVEKFEKESRKSFKVPRITFVSNPVSYMINPNTSGQILLGVSKRSVILAATYQKIVGPEHIVYNGGELNNKFHSTKYNGLMLKITGEGTLGSGVTDTKNIMATVKLYKKAVSEATIIDLIREAQILDYVGKRSSAVPKFLGLLKVTESEHYLPFALTTLLFEDSNDIATVSLERLLLAEVTKRKDENEIILENLRWIKMLYRLTKSIQEIHRCLIVINNLKLSNVLTRFCPEKGWTPPKICNFGRAYILDGFSEKFIKGPIAKAERNIYKTYSMSFEMDIYQLGSIIKKVDLCLNLGLDGIYKFCEPATKNSQFWSTCDVADALEGAIIELENSKKVKSAVKTSLAFKQGLIQTVCPCLNDN